MRKIKKFEPLSVMRIAAICYGAIGLLEGALFSVVFQLFRLPARTTNTCLESLGSSHYRANRKIHLLEHKRDTAGRISKYRTKGAIANT